MSSTSCSRVPKLCGADVELGNSVLGLASNDGTGRIASRLLLAEIDGLPAGGGEAGELPAGEPLDPQDWARKYLPANGSCCYIDMDHLEVTTPEVLGAHEHVAAWHAMLRITRRALDAANRRLPEGHRLQVLVNNSDGFSHSYGSHLNFLLTRRAWDDLFRRRFAQLVCLAAYQASSIVFTGQGKVGSENGAAPVDYQISQRVDFFEEIVGPQTTYARPLVNSRDEPLCGPACGGEPAHDVAARRLARLHCIFYDANLCQVATLLKCGVMQLVLAMLESGWVDLDLILDQPVAAVRRWSHDPELRAEARLLDGRRRTAVELQLGFFEAAERFVSRGDAEGIVPRAAEILRLWGDVLELLRARDFDALAPRLDWVLKRRTLETALVRHRGLDWSSREIKVLDHLYASLSLGDGLYWAHEAAGRVEAVVDPVAIERLVHEPPETTRAWTRAMLLRAAGTDRVEHVDWDRVRIRCGGSGDGSSASRTVDLSDPLGATRAHCQGAFAECADIEDLVDRLRSPPRLHRRH
jgi:hypothetical protein